MTKSQIKADLMKYTEGRPFISITELRKVMHIGKDGASNMVSGLCFIKNGNRKDYLIEDIAERLCERKSY